MLNKQMYLHILLSGEDEAVGKAVLSLSSVEKFGDQDYTFVISLDSISTDSDFKTQLLDRLSNRDILGYNTAAYLVDRGVMSITIMLNHPLFNGLLLNAYILTSDDSNAITYCMDSYSPLHEVDNILDFVVEAKAMGNRAANGKHMMS